MTRVTLGAKAHLRALARMVCALSLFAWCGVGAALAQDDEPATLDLGMFELHSVLIASFAADQPFLDAEATRVTGLVREAIAEKYIVLGMDEVKPFTDFSAEVYLRSCPDGRYIGCVFVVGGRAETDWTIGGTVRAVDGGYEVFVSFIDVDEAKLVLDFDVVLDGTNDEQFKQGVIQVMDSLVNGEIQSLDVRGDPEGDARAKAEAEARDQEARRFTADSVYEDPEELERGEVGEDPVPRRERRAGVTRDDLDALDLDEVAPWDEVGLSKGQYKIYRNSKTKLREFKQRLRGRQGQVLVRLSMQVGSGPWGQRHEMWYVQDNSADPNNLQPRDIRDEAAVQVQRRALSFGGQLEVAVGVLPWLELGVFGGVRQAPYEYRFFPEIVGVANDVPAVEAVGSSSFQVGARLGAVPFPAYPVRPTLHVGGSYWVGTPLRAVVSPLPTALLSSEMRPNNFILLHIQPGAEVSVGKWVMLWTRFDLDIPVLGRSSQVFNRGNATLSQRPSADTDTGFALGGSVGLTFRVPLKR